MVDVDVTTSHIEKVARSLRGSAGPSGTDGEQWKNMLLRFGNHSAELRESVASLTRYLSNGIVDWVAIKSVLARRGVALNKCPGVRPIAIGEVLQRITAKAMALVTGEDVTQECGADQLCGGTKAGIEGAIHGISQLFNDQEEVGLLLMDASNAFNALSRPVALWNARILWPRCARFLFNCYQGFPTISFRNSNDVILSKEGTCQGDPLAMLFYAVGILPLIKKLKSDEWYQNWYADDSSCLGKLRKIKSWFDLLIEEGPKWGYYPEPSKSILIIKEGMEREAENIFEGTNIKIVHSHPFLGGMIGPDSAKDKYVEEKVKFWVEAVKKFSIAAEKSPQAALAAFTKSLQFEWAFLQRVVDADTEKYLSLKNTIRGYLTPAIMKCEVQDIEHELFALPAKLGGLAIKDPMNMAERSLPTSQKSVEKIIDAIKSGEALDLNAHSYQVKSTVNEEIARREHKEKEESDRIISALPAKAKRCVSRVIQGNASHWLTVIPTSADNFDLSPTQFRDALYMRYGKEISLPQMCDGCGDQMNVTHALNCKKGGLVKHGHDQHRDHCAAMAKLAWGRVGIEPVMREASDGVTALYGDFWADSVWDSGRTAFFDNRIVNADAASYESCSWAAVSNRHARQKHMKYDLAAEDNRGSFTPLICIVNMRSMLKNWLMYFQQNGKRTLGKCWHG
uniref:Reverse transcriptase domain-containing protein n=1 Tax=Cacopsylla melanoneura TaxID=428564 RepID=A0A8D8LKG0_9HEMI